MEQYQINHLHYLIEELLKGFGVEKHMVYTEDQEDILFVTVYFRRDHSNHPDVNHRIDFWVRETARAETIAGIMGECFEEEWEFSKEIGYD